MRRPGGLSSSGSTPQDIWVGGDRAPTARPRSGRSTYSVRTPAAIGEAPTLCGPKCGIDTRLGSSSCGDGPNEPKTHTKISPSTSSGPERRMPRIWGDLARGMRSLRAGRPVLASRHIHVHRKPCPCPGHPPKCRGGAQRAQRRPSGRMVAVYHPLPKTTWPAVDRCARRAP